MGHVQHIRRSASGESGNPEASTSFASTRPWVPHHKRRIQLAEALSLCIGVVVPNLVLLTFFSTLGVGVRMYNAVSPPEVSLAGDACIGLSVGIAALYYVFDWPTWTITAKGILCVPPWTVFLLGSVMKGKKYPFFPILVISFHTAINLGFLRVCVCRGVARSNFYGVVSAAGIACAAASMALWTRDLADGRTWDDDTRAFLAGQSQLLYDNIYRPARLGARSLDYEADCGPRQDVSMWSTDEKTQIRKACTEAMTILFMAWACPFISFCINAVISVFSLAVALTREREEMAGTERFVKKFAFFLFLLLTGMYASSMYFSAVSLSLGGTMMAFFTAGLFALMSWAYIELDKTDITDRAMSIKSSKLVRHMPAWSWNVLKAMFVVAFNVAIPAFFALDSARQKFRCCRGIEDVEPRPRFTPTGRDVLAKAGRWQWAITLWWVCVLGEVYFCMQVVAAKCTYIFLSWLNLQLASLPLWQVSSIVFSIGLLMFLIPVVPGVAVYLFAGVVIAEQGRQEKEVGFTGGILVAIGMCFVLKLVACTLQYLLGYAAGQHVWVQKTVGVDRVFTRATDIILQKPGLSVGKVGVLVGGPDWPVSVGCGILRVDVLQMLLGTCPVIFVLAPVVLAGAYTAQVDSADSSSERMFAVMLTGFALLFQALCGLSATYSIMHVVEEQGEELAQPRPEHAQLAVLSCKEESYHQAMQQATSWDTMSLGRRILIVVAASLMILSSFIFAFFDEMCFENFSINGRIDDPLDEMGLGGNPINIIVWPYGYLPLSLFTLSVFLHYLFVKSTDIAVREILRRELEDPTAGALSPIPAETIGQCADRFGDRRWGHSFCR